MAHGGLGLPSSPVSHSVCGIWSLSSPTSGNGPSRSSISSSSSPPFQHCRPRVCPTTSNASGKGKSSAFQRPSTHFALVPWSRRFFSFVSWFVILLPHCLVGECASDCAFPHGEIRNWGTKPSGGAVVLLWEYVELDRHAGMTVAVTVHGVSDVVERANHEWVIPVAVEPDGAEVGWEVRGDPLRFVPRHDDAVGASSALGVLLGCGAAFERPIREWCTRQHDPIVGVEKNDRRHFHVSSFCRRDPRRHTIIHAFG